MPKSYPRRNAAEAINASISAGICVVAGTMRGFRNTSEMAVGQPRQRYVPARAVQKPRNRGSCDHGADRGHGDPGDIGGLRERVQTILRVSRTGSRSRRRRKRWPRCRPLRGHAAPQRQRTRERSVHRSRRRRRTPRIVWRGLRPGRPTRPSRHGHDRAPRRRAHCAAAAGDSGRPACLAFPRRPPAPLRPRRLSGYPGRARHRRCVPVTTTRSPGFAPLRWTIWPAGTRPNAVIEIIRGPGVDTVSPPSSGQPNVQASSPSPRANGRSHVSSALRNASVSTKPAGVAPLAARSERFTRSALRAIVSGGSSDRKCTPSTMASVVTTMSSPAALQDRGIVGETEARRDRSRAA